MQKSMTSGNSLRLLLTFMIPLIIGNIFQQMYSISDLPAIMLSLMRNS